MIMKTAFNGMFFKSQNTGIPLVGRPVFPFTEKGMEA